MFMVLIPFVCLWVAVSFSSVVSKAEHFLLLGDAAKSLHKRGRPYKSLLSDSSLRTQQ